MHRLRAEFGIETLSLQGGGIINGAFLKAGLLDELSLLIYPGIDGLSGVPSVFEALEPAASGRRPGSRWSCCMPTGWSAAW